MMRAGSGHLWDLLGRLRDLRKSPPARRDYPRAAARPETSPASMAMRRSVTACAPCPVRGLREGEEMRRDLAEMALGASPSLRTSVGRGQRKQLPPGRPAVPACAEAHAAALRVRNSVARLVGQQADAEECRCQVAQPGDPFQHRRGIEVNRQCTAIPVVSAARILSARARSRSCCEMRGWPSG